MGEGREPRLRVDGMPAPLQGSRKFEGANLALKRQALCPGPFGASPTEAERI